MFHGGNLCRNPMLQLSGYWHVQRDVCVWREQRYGLIVVFDGPLKRPAFAVTSSEVAMKLPVTGGCRCGSIRYQCSAEPAFSWKCHCRDCQQASGGAYCPVMYVPKSAMTITGTAEYHDVEAESGNKVSRGFCAKCGSNLFVLADLVPDLHGIWASSLDDPDNFRPQVHVWTGSASSWNEIGDGLPRIEKAPNEEQFNALLAENK